MRFPTCKSASYNCFVEFVWTEHDAAYIRSRSARYPGALDVELDWTQEVLTDANLLELSPHPSSRVGMDGFVGWSAGAGRVLVVLAYRDLDGRLHGINAWPATGRDLATYQKGLG